MSKFHRVLESAPLLLALLAAPLARAATVTVPGDFATVQEAVAAVEDDADPGEVILASDGPFDESVRIFESVTIRAADGFTPVLERSTGFRPPIGIDARAGAPTVVVLRGLVLRATNQGGGPGRAVGISNNATTEPLEVRVDRSRIEIPVGDHGIRAGSGAGGPVRIEVTDSFFETIGDGAGQPACIYLDPPNFPLEFVATGNRLRFSRASGIVLDPGVGAPITATIDGNRFEGFLSEVGAGRTGLDVGGPNAPGDIRATAVATNNLFVDVDAALEVNGQAENELTVFFANNTAVGAGFASVYAATFGTSSAEVSLYNNVLVGGEIGISVFEGNGTALLLDAGHNLLFDHLTDYDGLAPAPTDVSADPQFVDADAGDFRLLAGSPAIDAGANAPPGGTLPPVDLDGRPRIVDGDGDAIAVVDIGAFEAPEPGAAPAAAAALAALAALRRGRLRSARAPRHSCRPPRPGERPWRP